MSATLTIPLEDVLSDELFRRTLTTYLTPVILNTMRVLKRVNPGDTYLEAYQDKYRRDPAFFDQYHLAWIVGTLRRPRRVLEIGTRTGLSLCQLLSSLVSHDGLEVHSFDLFNDGFISPKLVELNLKVLNLPHQAVQYHVGDSAETVPEFLALHPHFQADYALVDGDHSKAAARRDLELVAPIIAPGGVIVFDDISTAPGECALLDVWEAFKLAHEGAFIFGEDLTGKGTAWAIKP